MIQILKTIIFVSLVLSTLHATSSEDELKAVVIGKFSHFIQWKNQSDSKDFIITVFRNHPFNSFLDNLYKNKKIRLNEKFGGLKTFSKYVIVGVNEGFFIMDYKKVLKNVQNALLKTS